MKCRSCFFDSFRQANSSCRADQPAEVTADTFGAHNPGLAVFAVKGYGLVASVHAGCIAAPAADA